MSTVRDVLSYGDVRANVRDSGDGRTTAGWHGTLSSMVKRFPGGGIKFESGLKHTLLSFYSRYLWGEVVFVPQSHSRQRG